MRVNGASVGGENLRMRAIYESLLSHYGPQGWWPSRGPFETIVGAVLTQNTTWTNAEAALANLRRAGLLDDWRRLEATDDAAVRSLIGPAGFQIAKTATLRRVVGLLAEADGGLDGLLSEETERLRRVLLALKGIGPETADAIMLYAAERPVYVADAYSRRVAARHELVAGEAGYRPVKDVFEAAFRGETAVLNEVHALVVRLCRDRCRKRPHCDGCPLAYDPHRAELSI